MTFFEKLASRRGWLTAVLVLPPALWLLFFLVAPYLSLFVQSVLGADEFGNVVYSPTLDHYARFNEKPLYYETLFATFEIAIIVTVIAVALSLPLAYAIAFKVKRYKGLVYTLVIVPLWVSYIVRAYAWKIILGREGILNSFLSYTGLTSGPIDAFLYSKIAVIIGLVHIFTPFVLMPVYTAFENIPRPLIEASKDLGAGRFTTFFRVVLPLALPGVIAGATFAFVLTLGDFMAVFLLGGPDTLMISNVVQNLFGTSDDKPLGSVIGIVMLVVVILLLEVTGRAERALGGGPANERRAAERRKETGPEAPAGDLGLWTEASPALRLAAVTTAVVHALVGTWLTSLPAASRYMAAATFVGNIVVFLGKLVGAAVVPLVAVAISSVWKANRNPRRRWEVFLLASIVLIVLRVIAIVIAGGGKA